MSKNSIPKVIYLPDYAKRQLEGSDDISKNWYDPIPYSLMPDRKNTFKLNVTKKVNKYDSLSEGYFYPDRNDELDDVIETLEQLTEKEITSIIMSSNKPLNLEILTSVNVSLVKKFPSGDLKPGAIFYNEKEKSGILLGIKNKKAIGLSLEGYFDCEYKYTQLNNVVTKSGWTGKIIEYIGFIDGEWLKDAKTLADTGKHFGNNVK